MADAGTVVLGTAFVGSLGAMLTYIANTVISDRNRTASAIDSERARTERAETLLEKCREKYDEEVTARIAAKQDLALCELKLARLAIEYGHSDTQQLRGPS
jgi:hypothetical protein